MLTCKASIVFQLAKKVIYSLDISQATSTGSNSSSNRVLTIELLKHGKKQTSVVLPQTF
jgi:hypothetical protein